MPLIASPIQLHAHGQCLHFAQTNNSPADTAGGEEEPVHEDTRAVIVRIKGQQSVPFILLLTGTVAGTAWGRGFTEKEILLCFSLLMNMFNCK